MDCQQKEPTMLQLDLFASAAGPLFAPPPPAYQPEIKGELASRLYRGKEVVGVDPRRLESNKGDIANSYSVQSLAEKGTVRNPFKFRGSEWVKTGGLYGPEGDFYECHRVVAPQSFDGPTAPYSETDWDAKRGSDLGCYHGMSAKHGNRPLVLIGPPVVFVAGEPEQGAIL
jgi:hypothetical protein